MHHLSSLNFNTLFFMPNLQQLPKWTPTGIRFGGQYLQKSIENDFQTAALKKLQKVNDNNAHRETQHLQKQVSRFREVTFLQFFSIC